MKNGPLRIIATLMLIVTLLTLSGLTATAETLFNAAAEKSCCDRDCDTTPTGTPASTPDGPCSTPDCPCFSCITMAVSHSFTLIRNSTELLLLPVAPPRYRLSAYVRSIDYPPELSPASAI